MIDKLGHIRNPLTVIAIFAAIAEISGTTVLPFIASENQATYIWFLMLFPCLLVVLFFSTLNFNHKVLYAPSDYKDESNFLKLFTRATPEEQEKKLKEEVDESTPEQLPAPGGQEPFPGTPPGINWSFLKVKSDQAAKYSLAERLAINRLAKEFGLEFRTNVSFKANANKRYVFDAVAFQGEQVHAVEVKLLSKFPFTYTSRVEEFGRELSVVADKLRRENKHLLVHYVAVLEGDHPNRNELETFLKGLLDGRGFEVLVHVFLLQELMSELAKP